MRLAFIILLVVVAWCLEPSCAVDLGKGKSYDPLILSNPSSSPTAIQHSLIGSYIMMPTINSRHYSFGVANLGLGSYHFGRDFQLGTIDNNYAGSAGSPFLLQFLADP